MSDTPQPPEFSLPVEKPAVPLAPQPPERAASWPLPMWSWGLVAFAVVLFARNVHEMPKRIKQETERNYQQQGDDSMSERVIEVKSRDDFDATIKSGGVVLADFYAPWCGPCRMQSPILHKLADELGDKVKILKVNTDELQELSTAYKVSSIPMLILFKDGAVHKQYVGLQQESILRDAIEATQ